MITKKKLEILIERCAPFKKPKIELEQYITPAPIAAEILNLAFLKGDIKDKVVFDLGCGTGRLAIGASLLEARAVKGFDIDDAAVEIAKKNSETLRSGAGFHCLDILELRKKCDTVLQNPPFGVQKKGADRQFLEIAAETGKVIYSMHKTSTREFIKDYVEKLGGEITEIAPVDFVLPHSYRFHKKRIKNIEVDVYRIERRD